MMKHCCLHMLRLLCWCRWAKRPAHMSASRLTSCDVLPCMVSSSSLSLDVTDGCTPTKARKRSASLYGVVPDVNGPSVCPVAPAVPLCPLQGQVNSSMSYSGQKGLHSGQRGLRWATTCSGPWVPPLAGWQCWLFELCWAFALRSVCLSLVFSLSRTPQRNLAVTGLQVKRDLPTTALKQVKRRIHSQNMKNRSFVRRGVWVA